MEKRSTILIFKAFLQINDIINVSVKKKVRGKEHEQISCERIQMSIIVIFKNKNRVRVSCFDNKD